MSHLLDTSVFHKLGRFPAVRAAVQEVLAGEAVASTCEPVIAEYCFSARSAEELAQMQQDMHAFYRLEAPPAGLVELIQTSLWGAGRARAAGAIDTLIAAYAIAANEPLVTCDSDFLHIALALRATQSSQRLRVIHIAEDGSITFG